MRWGVPAAAVLVVAGAIGAGPVIAAVQGDPQLPELTADQLVTEVAARWGGPGSVAPMSGTIVETASLGIPGLPAAPAGPSPLALLSGSHELKVWYGSADQFRLAIPGPMSEQNLIHNQGQTWWWDSAANTATKIKLPSGTTTPAPLPTAAVTPPDAARLALAMAESDTAVSVGNDATVAGRAAYELVLAPKAPESLIRDVRLAVDGETMVPLRVQIFAKGAAEPAFEVGFDSITFAKPAPENFTFTPPPGAKVTEGELPEFTNEAPRMPADDLAVTGKGWTAVVSLPFDAAQFKDNPLLAAARTVEGGKVIATKLVSALITDDGRLLVGAVTPETLEKAAG
ncbi:LolA family protein [Herbidospora sp. RD11066]